MSLWAEHMHMVNDLFNKPESLDCVRMVNNIADENWRRYSKNEFMILQGHLLKYPISINSSGIVGSLPGHETFPDVGGKVLGCRSTLPDALTT